uniref:Uncharacterized protein n=1 Tax=Anguilla anguilla TaxID=7936 RepID=A0A0E9TR52_ANGAN
MGSSCKQYLYYTRVIYGTGSFCDREIN